MRTARGTASMTWRGCRFIPSSPQPPDCRSVNSLVDSGVPLVWSSGLRILIGFSAERTGSSAR